MNSIIEVKDVTFTYSGAQRHALERVSLAVAEGEFVGIIGPSGAGKSTLASVMSGAVPHHFSGELYGACLVDGNDTCEVTLTDVSRLVGSVLQDIDAQFVASNVLDEPTSGLDYRECMTVMETVRDMAAAGSAVVMVCHDMEVVSDFADRLVVMANGEILGRGTCADVFANDGLMQSAFVEPPQAIALAKKLAAEVSPTFAGLSDVSDIVAIAKELACRA